ncbi:MAG: hypothetical protein AB1410_09975 [Acidobacteriota bacterium]
MKNVFKYAVSIVVIVVGYGLGLYFSWKVSMITFFIALVFVPLGILIGWWNILRILVEFLFSL